MDYEIISEADLGTGWAGSRRHCPDAPGGRSNNHIPDQRRNLFAHAARLLEADLHRGLGVEWCNCGVERSGVVAKGVGAGTPESSGGAGAKRRSRKGKVGNGFGE